MLRNLHHKLFDDSNQFRALSKSVETSHDPATDAIDSLGVLRRGTALRAGALRDWQPSLSH